MSDFAVEVVAIDEVTKHPNADRLDLLKIRDWQCVAPVNEFQAGDKAIYFPVDSILPPHVEQALFPPDSKVKLTKSRVKTIRLRGAISQGMAVANTNGLHAAAYPVGADLTQILGVTKYEAPEPSVPTPANGNKKPKKNHPDFHEYTKIQNAKNYPDLFEAGEVVVVTEKIHGTNFRAGWVPYNANTLWKKIKKLFRLAPAYEFVYGSHRVQLQNKDFAGFYNENVYLEAVNKYELKSKIPEGMVIYGEIYGDGIQKGYAYGCKKGERKLAVFDATYNGEYEDYTRLMQVCDYLDLPTVPELYRGPFDKAQILKMRDGKSVLCPDQKVREGVVVKPVFEQATYAGRKILKYISDEYLLKNQDNETVAH